MGRIALMFRGSEPQTVGDTTAQVVGPGAPISHFFRRAAVGRLGGRSVSLRPFQTREVTTMAAFAVVLAQ